MASSRKRDGFFFEDPQTITIVWDWDSGLRSVALSLVKEIKKIEGPVDKSYRFKTDSKVTVQKTGLPIQHVISWLVMIGILEVNDTHYKLTTLDDKEIKKIVRNWTEHVPAPAFDEKTMELAKNIVVSICYRRAMNSRL